MKEIGEMLHAEVLEELDALNDGFTAADYERLETELMVRAYVLGWTGDLLKQPPRAVLAAARAVREQKLSTLPSALP